MYEEDIDNMTPYELALSSNSIECKNFVLECLTPVKQNEDEKEFKNLPANNTSSQTSATTNKKLNLRRIGSMLRLRRAKDINHEPAYLYRQKFRPAPVSLPEQSKISGFKNEPVVQPENEDDLNDAVIDELINHVNSAKKNEKTLTTTLSPNSELNQDSSFENESNEKIIGVSNRVSRYEQHQESKNNDKQESSIEKKDKTNSPPKKSETSNLGIILRNSLHSSSRETTPTIIKLSRSGTPTPLLQSVAQNDEQIGSKLVYLAQKRVSNNERSTSPQYKPILTKTNSDNSTSIYRQTEFINRRYSLSQDEKKLEETKVRRQSLNNYQKLSNVDFNFKNENQIYEPEPDYWDMPYNNNMEHLSKTDITIEKIEKNQPAVSLAQVILKSVRESINKKNENKSVNEEIIISETVRIISDQHEIKNLQTPNENKVEFYNIIENGDNLSQFKTSLKVNGTSLDDPTGSFVSGFEEFPQPPTQSFLKLTQMECSDSVSTPSPADSTNMPPPPPPPPLPQSTPPALTLNLNSETLLIAKNNLKIKLHEERVDLKDNRQKINDNPKDLKKNNFLLQEIQNHRLYNTKKDYVLEYLDRNNMVPSVSSLSNGNLNKAEEEEKKLLVTQSSPVSSTLTSVTNNTNKTIISNTNKNQTPASNYERFPYLKNKNQPNNYNKLANGYTCGSYLSNAKRAQSNTPINRQALPANQTVSTSRSFSVERPIRTEEPERKLNEETKNNNCVIIVDKNIRESIKKQDSVNSATKEISTSQDNAHLANVKKFKQLIPQEKLESELDRVFRKRALQTNS
ncbi:unnamed protein product [Brachionus calyciflorus]|uniref:Uncharacterized protein n=1 Tax=Brachionus calyciflorus TaxID=104777 RepID=A0A813PEJ4_9BILA|nr:unnamed protein product [Brachionus calyciflorus]